MRANRGLILNNTQLISLLHMQTVISPFPTPSMSVSFIGEKLRCITTAKFTSKGIPLPIDENEEILYSNKDIIITIDSGCSIPSKTSNYFAAGTLYLLTTRLVFLDKKNESNSICIFLDSILCVEKDVVFLDVPGNVAKVVMNFRNSQKSVFFYILKKLICKCKENVPKRESSYYCELI